VLPKNRTTSDAQAFPQRTGSVALLTENSLAKLNGLLGMRAFSHFTPLC
jgi:hypothetical protein